MSNLSTYKNQELKNSIKTMQIKDGTTKDGNPYEYLEIEFINGFKTRTYFNSMNEFGYLNAFETASRQNQNIVSQGTPVSNTGVPF